MLGFFMPGKLILIGGVSRSGKSILAQKLNARLENSIHLEQDQFTKDIEKLTLIRDRINWELPETIDWQKWDEKIRLSLTSHQYVIAEGIFAFNQPSINTKADYYINLLLDKKDFLKERQKETRWGYEPIWYLEYVWDAHLKHNNPHKVKFNIEASLTEIIPLEQIVHSISNS